MVMASPSSGPSEDPNLWLRYYTPPSARKWCASLSLGRSLKTHGSHSSFAPVDLSSELILSLLDTFHSESRSVDKWKARNEMSSFMFVAEKRRMAVGKELVFFVLLLRRLETHTHTQMKVCQLDNCFCWIANRGANCAGRIGQAELWRAWNLLIRPGWCLMRFFSSQSHLKVFQIKTPPCRSDPE